MVVNETVLFLLSFLLMFVLLPKRKYQTADFYVEEPCVYVTKYGDRYHAFHCRYLRQSKIEKGLYYAMSNGYKAGSYCKGIPYGTIEVHYYRIEIKNRTDEVTIQ